MRYAPNVLSIGRWSDDPTASGAAIARAVIMPTTTKGLAASVVMSPRFADDSQGIVRGRDHSFYNRSILYFVQYIGVHILNSEPDRKGCLLREPEYRRQTGKGTRCRACGVFEIAAETGQEWSIRSF